MPFARLSFFLSRGQVERALQQVRGALALNRAHADSWHLLALLLSAKKEYESALEACDFAIEQFPDRIRYLRPLILSLVEQIPLARSLIVHAS
jgi:tetratricopeptide (TPR) repeat protein